MALSSLCDAVCQVGLDYRVLRRLKTIKCLFVVVERIALCVTLLEDVEGG